MIATPTISEWGPGRSTEPTRDTPDVETLLAMGWELNEIEDLLDHRDNLTIAQRREDAKNGMSSAP